MSPVPPADGTPSSGLARRWGMSLTLLRTAPEKVLVRGKFWSSGVKFCGVAIAVSLRGAVDPRQRGTQKRPASSGIQAPAEGAGMAVMRAFLEAPESEP